VYLSPVIVRKTAASSWGNLVATFPPLGLFALVSSKQKWE
jgi:hypothetical protein